MLRLCVLRWVWGDVIEMASPVRDKVESGVAESAKRFRSVLLGLGCVFEMASPVRYKVESGVAEPAKRFRLCVGLGPIFDVRSHSLTLLREVTPSLELHPSKIGERCSRLPLGGRPTRPSITFPPNGWPPKGSHRRFQAQEPVGDAFSATRCLIENQ